MVLGSLLDKRDSGNIDAWEGAASLNSLRSDDVTEAYNPMMFANHSPGGGGGGSSNKNGGSSSMMMGRRLLFVRLVCAAASAALVVATLVVLFLPEDGGGNCSAGFRWKSEDNICVDIDECIETHPCMNANYCTNVDGDYECDCTPKWQGKNCEEEIVLVNECETNAGACHHHGTCTDLDIGYECSCDDWWWTDSSYCENTDICYLWPLDQKRQLKWTSKSGQPPVAGEGTAPLGGIQDGEGAHFGSALANIRYFDDKGAIHSTTTVVGEDHYDDKSGRVLIMTRSAETTRSEPETRVSVIASENSLSTNDRFGAAVTVMGGTSLVAGHEASSDLVVGAPGDSSNRGALYVVTLLWEVRVGVGAVRVDGPGQRMTFTTTLEEGDTFGSALANVGDEDDAEVFNLAVGAPGSNDGRGAIYLFVKNPGDIELTLVKVINHRHFLGPLAVDDGFGSSIAGLGRSEGIVTVAVGAPFDDDAETADSGAVYVLNLDSQSGEVKREQKISRTQGGLLGPIKSNDRFGTSVALIGDLDSDGVADIAVGAPGNDEGEGGADEGAVYVVLLTATGNKKVKGDEKICTSTGLKDQSVVSGDAFGHSVASGQAAGGTSGTIELVVGAHYDSFGGAGQGAIHFLEVNAKMVPGCNAGQRCQEDISSSSSAGGRPVCRAVTWCDLNPCLNGGECEEDGNFFACKCDDMWAGDTCEIDANECLEDTDTCAGSDSVCINSDVALVAEYSRVEGGGFECSACPKGFGPNPNNPMTSSCDYDLDECSTLDAPCNGQGECELTPNNGWYSCGCNEYFTGPTCEIDVNECSIVQGGELPCGYNAICENIWGGDPICTPCADGKRSSEDGMSCVDINECKEGGPNTCGTDPNQLCVDLKYPGTFTCVPCGKNMLRSPNGYSACQADPCHTGAIEEIVQVRKNKKDSKFGSSTASLGNIDGFGPMDMAVGAPGHDEGRGAVYVITYDASSVVDRKREEEKIRRLKLLQEGGLALGEGDNFGCSVASMGAMNSDDISVSGIVVGACGDDEGGKDTGAIYIIYLTPVGEMDSYQKISATTTPIMGAYLGANDHFGTAVAKISGDWLKADIEAFWFSIVVGAPGYFNPATKTLEPATGKHSYYHIMITTDGKFADVKPQRYYDYGGRAVAGFGIADMGDFYHPRGEGNGLTIAVSDPKYKEGKFPGGSYVYFDQLLAGKSKPLKISEDTGYSAVANIGDVDGDGIVDIAVGNNRVLATRLGYGRGEVLIVLLGVGPSYTTRDGRGWGGGRFGGLTVYNTPTVKGKQLIKNGQGGLSSRSIKMGDFFGGSLASFGDSDGDGIVELAIGAYGEDGGNGAIHIVGVPTGFVDLCPPPSEDEERVCSSSSGGPTGQFSCGAN